MRFHIDDSKIYIDLQKLSDGFENWYKANKHYGYTLETEKGKIDFSPKSIPRLALKAAMTPIAIPMIKMIYKLKHKEPIPHEKHEDLIDYYVLSFIRYIALFNGDDLYVKTVERPDSDERAIVSVTAALPARAIEGPAEEKEVEASGSRGTAYVRSGENGDGENKADKRNHKEKAAGSALA